MCVEDSKPVLKLEWGEKVPEVEARRDSPPPRL